MLKNGNTFLRFWVGDFTSGLCLGWSEVVDFLWRRKKVAADSRVRTLTCLERPFKCSFTSSLGPTRSHQMPLSFVSFVLSLERLHFSLSVGPDLAKFCHFGATLKHIGRFESVLLVFAKMLSLFGQICYAIAQIFIGLNSQIKNLATWSHCSLYTYKDALSLSLSMKRTSSIFPKCPVPFWLLFQFHISIFFTLYLSCLCISPSSIHLFTTHDCYLGTKMFFEDELMSLANFREAKVCHAEIKHADWLKIIMRTCNSQSKCFVSYWHRYDILELVDDIGSRSYKFRLNVLLSFQLLNCTPQCI